MPKKQQATEQPEQPTEQTPEPALYVAMIWPADRARASKKAAAVDAKDLAEHLGSDDLGEVVIVKVVGRVEAVTEYRVR